MLYASIAIAAGTPVLALLGYGPPRLWPVPVV